MSVKSALGGSAWTAAHRIALRNAVVASVVGVLSAVPIVVAPVATSAGIAGAALLSTDTRDVAISGDRAYIAAGAAGLQVVDIKDPDAPVLLGASEPLGESQGVVVSGGLVFVAEGAAGLQVFEVSKAGIPSSIGELPTAGDAVSVSVRGRRAFVLDSIGGLYVCDVTDAREIRELARLEIGDPVDHHWIGDHLLVADSNEGVLFVDIADPTHPVIAARVSVPGRASGVYVYGHHAYVACMEEGLAVIDITDWDTPVLVAELDTPGESRDIVVDGNEAYVADGSGGLQILDISQPAAPAWKDEATIPGNAHKVVVTGDRAFLVGDECGLQTVQVWDAIEPQRVGFLSIPERTREIQVQGDLAFVTGDEFGLEIIDISRPWSPELLSSVKTNTNTWALCVDGDYVYVGGPGWPTGEWIGWYSIDVSDPAAPTIVASIAMEFPVRDIVVDGDFAYVAANGVHAFDISDPRYPVLLGRLEPGGANNLFVDGRRLFASGRDAGLDILDVTDPRQITRVGAVGTNDSFTDELVVAGNYAYMITNPAASFLVAIDISDPAQPTVVDHVSTGVTSTGLACSGDRLYIADSFRDLVAVDISDPTQLSAAIVDQLSFSASDVAVSGNYAFVLGSQYYYWPDEVLLKGLRVYRIGERSNAGLNPPESASVLVSPTPFRGWTDVTFDVPTSRELRVEVVDASGRVVQRLRDGFVSAGRHRVAWDANAGARDLASGVYWVRVDGEAARAVLIR